MTDRIFFGLWNFTQELKSLEADFEFLLMFAWLYV